MNTKAYHLEWARMLSAEKAFLQKGRKRKNSRLNQLLESKIPDGLQDKLDAAFCKAFQIILKKGTNIIEMTYDRTGIEEEFQEAFDQAGFVRDRRALGKASRKASRSGAASLVISGVEGIGLGVLGIGLPDIPLFTANLLRSVYKIALHYGYGYEEPQDKYFALKVVQAALSTGEDLTRLDRELNEAMEVTYIPDEEEMEEQIRQASQSLSSELLYMKFLQGMPVVGAVGGAYDVTYMRKVQQYATAKYWRRYLLDIKTGGFTSPDGIA